MKPRYLQLIAFVVVLAAASGARAESKDDPWAAFRFLIGEWVASGDSGSGRFTLVPELDGKILVRRNRTELLPAGRGPAAVREDLMVIYPGKAGQGAQAIYWDNKGHVIRYAVAPAIDARTLTFVSDRVAGRPRFRLSYVQGEKETVSVKFEIAPPDKPEAFKTYLEGKARRKAIPQTGK
jgi:hypothetical protein